MYTYLFTTTLSLLLTFSLLQIKIKLNNICIENRKDFSYYILGIISFSPFVVVSSIRYGIGIDYFIYEREFQAIAHGWDSTVNEKGYITLMKLVSIFTDNSQWIFVITSVITIFLICISIYRDSDNILFSILIFYISANFMTSLCIVRQFISIAIFIYSLKYIEKRNFVKYMVMIFIAISFHSSSYIYIPLYFSPYLQKGKIYKLYFAGVIIIFIPFAQGFFTDIINMTRFSVYLVRNSAEVAASNSDIILNLSIFILCYIYYRRNKNDSKIEIYLTIQFLACLFSNMSVFFPIMGRLILSVSPIQLLLVPKIVKLEKNKIKKFILFLAIVTLYIIKFSIYIRDGGYGELIYQSII